MAIALAFVGVIALIGGALWLMWSPPSQHDSGRDDSASAGGDGHYGNDGGGGGHGGSH